MQLVNLKDASEQVSFAQAVKQGLGRNQGLFFPTEIPALDDIDGLLALPFAERSIKILSSLIGSELGEDMVAEIVNTAFTFPAPVAQVTMPLKGSPIPKSEANLEFLVARTRCHRKPGNLEADETAM